MKRFLVFAIGAACSVAFCADSGDVRLGEITIPPPQGYVKISKGHPLDAILSKLENPDKQNEVLAHYVRSSVLEPDGSISEGGEVLQGLITLKVPRLLKGHKIDSADFERFSGVIAAGVQKGVLSAQGRKLHREIASAQKKALGESDIGDKATVGDVEILDSQKLDDGSICLGIAQNECDEEGGVRTKVVTSVFSCCAGHMLIVAHASATHDIAKAKSIHESSQNDIAKWLSSIRQVSGTRSSEVRRDCGALSFGGVRPRGELLPTRRKSGWRNFSQGALIGLFVWLLCVVFRRIRSNGGTGGNSSTTKQKDDVGEHLSETDKKSERNVSDDILTGWKKVLALRPLADAGNSKAQFELGMIYFLGKVVVDDFRVARRLFALSAEHGNGFAAGLYAATKCPCDKKFLETPPVEPEDGLIAEWRHAAENGSPDGCFCYGLTLLRKSTSEVEISKAVDYLRSAADAGFPTAQYVIGVGMLYGCGTLARDERGGALLIGKAGMSGHDEAMLYFADFCRQGILLPKDEKRALAYLQEAADLGNATAQRLMSIAYANGDGVAKDAQKAKEYLDLSEGIHRPQVDWIKLMMRHMVDSECDAPVRNADGSLTFKKIPPGGAMAMLQKTFEMNKPPKPKVEDGELSFLNAGQDGILRGRLWTTQQLVVIDELSCRLYLPKDWNTIPEIEVISPYNHIARLAGPKPHEWVSVERLHLSPEHVQDDLGDWVNASRLIFGNLNLHPHSDRSSGVVKAKEISFARLNRRDTMYMKYHQADDMAAFVGTIEIEGRLHRLFFVIVRRGNESWKFEYVFPANDGVTRESLFFRPEEIVSAVWIFVPIETHGRVQCVICGEKMDDPVVGSNENQIEVLLKDYFLFDDMQIEQAGLNVPCCASCYEKIRHTGVSREKIESIPDIRSQLAKGASILEIKCGKEVVPLIG